MTHYTRREFTRLALLGLPAARLLSAVRPLVAAGSNVAGVRLGLNVPYSFGNNAMSGDDVLKNCLLLGVTALELRSQPVEAFLGSPPPTPRPAAADSAARAAAAAMAKGNAERLRQWRLTADASGAKAFRKKYEDAGVLVEIVKFDNIYAMVDGELDFAYKAAI